MDTSRNTRFFFIALMVALLPIVSMSQTNAPPLKDPAGIMRELRIKMLTTDPAQFGNTQTNEYPKVFGVVMDWPIGEPTATVVALSTGDASIYTTGTFGVFGGIGHENVRSAARNCVKTAQKYFEEAVPTKEYPYPKSGGIRFYLVCYDGVRVIETDAASVRNETDKHYQLYFEAQSVVTELRLITERQKGQQR